MRIGWYTASLFFFGTVITEPSISRDVETTFLDRTGTPLELSFLLAALLRKAGYSATAVPPKSFYLLDPPENSTLRTVDLSDPDFLHAFLCLYGFSFVKFYDPSER